MKLILYMYVQSGVLSVKFHDFVVTCTRVIALIVYASVNCFINHVHVLLSFMPSTPGLFEIHT